MTMTYGGKPTAAVEVVAHDATRAEMFRGEQELLARAMPASAG